MPEVSDRAIGRLGLYRRLLKETQNQGKTHVFSHELAVLAGCTPAQVRRDVMTIGCSGSPAKGYDIDALIRSISRFLDPEDTLGVALVGVGNLGRALLSHFVGWGAQYSIVAAFDNDPDRVNRVIHGCRCYPVQEMPRVIEEKDIRVAIIAVPASEAQSITNQLCRAGVRSLVNFAPVRLWVREGVYVENVDVTMALERVAYFARESISERV